MPGYDYKPAGIFRRHLVDLKNFIELGFLLVRGKVDKEPRKNTFLKLAQAYRWLPFRQTGAEVFSITLFLKKWIGSLLVFDLKGNA